VRLLRKDKIVGKCCKRKYIEEVMYEGRKDRKRKQKL